MDARGMRSVVIGAGASGLSAARLLASRGADVIVNDRRDREALGDRAHQADALGLRLSLGGHDEDVFEGAQLVVVSPGVPPLPVLERLEARGVEVIAEVELAARFLAGALIGITGTNGKSTVTTLVGEMMKRTGRPTFVGGNLGVALCDAVSTEAAGTEGVVVAELSSFQLERVRTLAPDVAVLLNVTADHLDRYESFESYAQAKGNIFAGQRADQHAVIPAADELCARLHRGSGSRPHRFGDPDGEVRLEGGRLLDTAGELSLDARELKLQGRHNLENACAAALVGRLAGAGVDAIAGALREVGGLPHRAERVRELDSVSYVDDSKATNVGAAVAALNGLASPSRRAVLIAGGVDKGGSYEPLRDRLREVGRGVVLLGQAADRIAESLSGLELPIERAVSMDEAVRRARALARPGDVVLLAPACSSFDMYASYAQRGDDFARAVGALEPSGGPR